MSEVQQKFILCIEDEPLTQILYESVLSKAGYEVEVYNTAAEALSRMDSVAPDLFIVDLSLPDMPGLELCDEIKKKKGKDGAPIVIVSADTSEETVTAGLHKEVLDYITKPFQPTELLAKVGVAINRAALLRQSSTASSWFAGRYELGHRLGSGASSVVFRAIDHHSSPPIDVALKIFALDFLTADDHRMAVVLREAYQMSKLQHPNTVKLVDFGKATDSRFYVAMEFVDGLSLHDIIMTSGAISADVAAYVGYEVCKTLSYLRELNSVHRDIKPANIMITDEGIKVIDFGLTRTSQDVLPVDQGFIAGTPTYLAPEILTRSHEESIASDIYSLGVTLYAALTKRLPFDGSITEILKKKLAFDVKPIRSHAPHVPPVLADFIMEMINPTPELRPTIEDSTAVLLGSMTPTINMARRPIEPNQAFESTDTATKVIPPDAMESD